MYMYNGSVDPLRSQGRAREESLGGRRPWRRGRRGMRRRLAVQRRWMVIQGCESCADFNGVFENAGWVIVVELGY